MLWIGVLYFVLCNEVVTDSTNSSTTNPTQQATELSIPDCFQFINHGFNCFTAELSSAVLNEQFAESDGEDVAGYSFESEDAIFDQDYDAFSQFAHQDALNIHGDYRSTNSYAAFGSLSQNRQSARSAVQSQQYYIYTMRMRIPQKTLNWEQEDRLIWTNGFINNLRVLPRDYSTGDDLERYIEFWTTYGTHIFKSVELGGFVEGTVVADKCIITDIFNNATLYHECLNAQYRGIALTQCQGYDSETSIARKRIVAKGGDLSTFGSMVAEFHDDNKVTEFGDWADSLSPDNYQVVGGLIKGIWFTVKQAILLAVPAGNHTLNDYSAEWLSDDEWTAIAEAMESAFDDYSERLDAEQNYLGECGESFSCFGGGDFKVEDCQCLECTPAVCCGLEVADSVSTIKVQGFMTLIITLFVVCWG